VLIDSSLSMNYGDPDKFAYAKRVAAALSYIGLVNYNRVNVVALSDTVVSETGGMRGRRSVRRMLSFIDGLAPSGTSNFAAACRKYALTSRGKGVCVVLSDFFDKSGFENGLRFLATGKQDLFAVQLLSPQEIDPAQLVGDLKLKDIEDGDTAEVSITQPLLKKYKSNLNGYCLSLKEYITRRGGVYLMSSTAVPFDTLVLNYLRERGLLG